MTINFTQTDSETGICVIGEDANRRAEDGGTPGSSEATLSIPGSATQNEAFAFTCIVGESVSWDAGNWTVRLNVTTENMFLAWSRVRIHRYNSSCVLQEAVALDTIDISLEAVGVKSTVVSGDGQTPSAGDKVVVSFHERNHSQQRYLFCPLIQRRWLQANRTNQEVGPLID